MDTNKTYFEIFLQSTPVTLRNDKRRLVKKTFSSPLMPEFDLRNLSLFKDKINFLSLANRQSVTHLCLRCSIDKVKYIKSKTGKLTKNYYERSVVIGRLFNRNAITKEMLPGQEIYPSFTPLIIEAINRDNIRKVKLSAKDFSDYIIKSITASGKHQIRTPDFNAVVDELAQYLCTYWTKFFEIMALEEQVDIDYRSNENLRDRNILPLELTLIAQKLGMVDGMIHTFKDGNLVTKIMDLMFRILILDSKAVGNNDSYSTEYLCLSDTNINSHAYGDVLDKMLEHMSTGVIKSEYKGARGIARLFSAAFGYLVYHQLSPAPKLLTKAQALKLANEEIESRTAEIKTLYHQQRPLVNIKGRRELATTTVVPVYGKRGRPPREFTLARKRALEQLAKEKELARAENAAASKERERQYKKHKVECNAQIRQMRTQVLDKWMAQTIEHQVATVKAPYGKGNLLVHNDFTDVNKTMYEPYHDDQPRKIIIDVTTISSSAHGNIYVQIGPTSQDKSHFKEVMKLLVALDQKTGLPVIIEPLVGAESDSKAFMNIAERIANLMQGNGLIIMDRGFAHHPIFRYLYDKGIQFLMMNNSKTKLEKELILSAGNEIVSKQWIYFDEQADVSYRHYRIAAKDLGLIKEDDELTTSSESVTDPLPFISNKKQEVSLLVFTDVEQYVTEGKRQWNKIRNAVTTFNTYDTVPDSKFKYPHLICKNNEGKYKVNPISFTDFMIHTTSHSIITNANPEVAIRALSMYSLRWDNELFFKAMKQTFPGLSCAAHQTESCILKICLVIGATIIKRYITSRIKNYKHKDENHAMYMGSKFVTYNDIINTLSKQFITPLVSSDLPALEFRYKEMGTLKTQKKNLAFAKELVGTPNLTADFAILFPKQLRKVNPHVSEYEKYGDGLNSDDQNSQL